MVSGLEVRVLYPLDTYEDKKLAVWVKVVL